jgi:hypothetical protein
MLLHRFLFLFMTGASNAMLISLGPDQRIRETGVAA